MEKRVFFSLVSWFLSLHAADIHDKADNRDDSLIKRRELNGFDCLKKNSRCLQKANGRF